MANSNKTPDRELFAQSARLALQGLAVSSKVRCVGLWLLAIHSDSVLQPTAFPR
jgi:hypothetical protein